MPIRPGDIVGDYHVLEPIDSGGMNAVFKVEHCITKRIEALKALPLSWATAPGEIRRFESEIQMHARLQHPNVAAVYSAVRHEDVFALIMEYVEGENLRRVLQRGPLPAPTALAIAADVLAGLECAHASGVTHGDVTPANIIVTPSGRAKLTDFGLACDHRMERLTAPGVPAGTAAYLSPEQVRGLDIDARSDLYGVGVVLYEMLAGRKLFEADSAFEMMRCHVEEPAPRVSSVTRRVPAAVDAAIARALAKEPAARPQSAREFQSALTLAPVRSGRLRRSLGAFGAVAAMAACSAVIIRRQEAVPPAPVAAPVPAPPVVVPPAPPQVEPAPAMETPLPEMAPKPKKRREPKTAPLAPKPLAPPVEDRMAVQLVEAPAVDATLPVAAPLPLPPGAPIANTAAEDSKQPERSGNRFVKALGKINPFRRSGKSDDPSK